MLSKSKAVITVTIFLVSALHVGAEEQRVDRDGIYLQIPSAAVAGEIVPVRVSAENPSMEVRIGTIAISVASDDVEVVNTSDGATTIDPRKKASQLPVFEKSDSGWVMAAKSQWPTAKNSQIELYADGWQGHESKELVVFLRFSHVGTKEVFSRATFGKKVGQGHQIETNMPADGPLDQMQLPAQVSRLSVSPNPPETGHSTQDFDAWEGTYKFVESIQSSPDASMVWDYTLSVTGDSGQLAIDGYQTLSRYICSFVSDGQELRVFLDSYEPDNQFEPFQKGDFLFVLERTGENKLVTRWGGVEPNVFANLSPGEHFALAKKQVLESPDVPTDGKTAPAVTASAIPSSTPSATPDLEKADALGAKTNQSLSERPNIPLSISTTTSNEGVSMEDLDNLLANISVKDLLYFLLFLTLIFSVMAGMFKFIRLLADVVIIIAGTIAAAGCVVASKNMPFGEAVISSILAGLVLAVVCTPLLPLSRLFRIRETNGRSSNTQIDTPN